MSLPKSIFLLAILLVGLGGCSDNGINPDPEYLGSVSGLVTDYETGLPLADTIVMLIADDFTVHGVKRVARDGIFSFTSLKSGSLLMYAFKQDYRIAEPRVSRINLGSGQNWLGTLDMMSDPQMLLDYRINGRVTDSVTGDPIGGVWIASTSLAEGANSVRYLIDNTGTSMTVSDENGYYSLPKFGVPENGDGPVIGLGPISCGRQGYRPRTFAGEGPDFAIEPYLPGGLLPAPADSTLELDIVLEPLSAGGLGAGETGFVTGQVVSDGVPQAGVMVTVTLMALADRDTVFASPEKVAVDGGFVLSEADGSFSFELEPGFYSLRAGVLPDDGWCYGLGPTELEVVAGMINAVGDVYLGPAIAPTSPVPGAVVVGTPGVLSWTAIEGAESYRVTASFNSVRQNTIGTTEDTELVWSLPQPDPGEEYLVRWTVYAEKSIGGEYTQTFSWFEIPATFTLMGPDGF